MTSGNVLVITPPVTVSTFLYVLCSSCFTTLYSESHEEKLCSHGYGCPSCVRCGAVRTAVDAPWHCLGSATQADLDAVRLAAPPPSAPLPSALPIAVLAPRCCAHLAASPGATDDERRCPKPAGKWAFDAHDGQRPLCDSHAKSYRESGFALTERLCP